MSLFDVLRYPFPTNSSYLNVVANLPQDMRMAFYCHPNYIPTYTTETLDGAMFRAERNTELLRQIILEWNT